MSTEEHKTEINKLKIKVYDLNEAISAQAEQFHIANGALGELAEYLGLLTLDGDDYTFDIGCLIKEVKLLKNKK